MESSLFRQKSIDRISSPEDLNDYIRVTKPGIWIILAAMIVLLIGMCIWGTYGSLDGEVNICVVSEGSSSYCYIAEKDAENCAEGMEVRVGGFRGKLGEISKEPDILDTRYPKEMMNVGEYSYGDTVYKAKVDITIPMGVYAGTIVFESVSPLTFVFN